MLLENKNAVIDGAGGAIGGAVARSFARGGGEGLSDWRPMISRRLSSRALLRWQFRLAHELLDAAMARRTPEAVHRCPSGMTVSAGVRYAQIALCEDLSVNGVLATGRPVALSTWAGRTGLREMPPLARPTDWRP
jgi:NAD(P)-dependent dehydrogenase (short-subunit alcohol dehydrogenase family)